MTAALGVALAGTLWWSGVGAAGAGAYLSSILLVGFGVFFVGVGRAEAAERRRQLRAAETPPAVRSR